MSVSHTAVLILIGMDIGVFAMLMRLSPYVDWEKFRNRHKRED